jgi:hypothetical protein
VFEAAAPALEATLRVRYPAMFRFSIWLRGFWCPCVCEKLRSERKDINDWGHMAC